MRFLSSRRISKTLGDGPFRSSSGNIGRAIANSDSFLASGFTPRRHLRRDPEGGKEQIGGLTVAICGIFAVILRTIGGYLHPVCPADTAQAVAQPAIAAWRPLELRPGGFEVPGGMRDERPLRACELSYRMLNKRPVTRFHGRLFHGNMGSADVNNPELYSRSTPGEAGAPAAYSDGSCPAALLFGLRALAVGAIRRPWQEGPDSGFP